MLSYLISNKGSSVFCQNSVSGIICFTRPWDHNGFEHNLGSGVNTLMVSYASVMIAMKSDSTI